MSSAPKIHRSQSKESITTSSYENTSIGSSSLISSKNERLKFLRKSPLKRARRSFINLYSYLFSALPIQTFVCHLMFGLRLTQMFICSCFYPNEKLYPHGTYSYNVGVFLSIFTRLFPISSNINDQIIFGWIYVLLFVIYIFFIGFFAYYFSKKSTLPSFVPSLLSYVFLILDHLPHCWAMSLIGAISSQDLKEIKDDQIVAIVLISITFIIFSVLHQLLNLTSIFFTPYAFMTADIWPQSTITYTLSIICFLAEFSGHYGDKTVSIILMCVILLLYIFIFVIMVFFGQFLNSFQESFFVGVIISSILNAIASLVLFALDKSMPEYVILIMVLLIFVIAIINSYIRTYRFIKSIRILDQLEESKENYSMFKRSSQVLPHIYVGFQVNHRYCLSYSIFIDSLNIFEDDFPLLSAFAKFLSMYPEEYAQMNWVFAMIQKLPKKNLVIKNVKSQLMTILMRRESTLSNELKKKLQSISNLIVTAKMRIRNTWEAALSGSTSELEPLFISYSTIIKQIDLKFTYLQNYHSNNQYALGALSNYERDVQANIELANYHREKARRIKMGHNDSIDQVYLYGRVTFPNLPPRPIYHNVQQGNQRAPRISSSVRPGSTSSVSNSEDGSINSMSGAEIIEDDDNLYLQDMQTRLRNTILNLAIPSYRVNIAISLALVVLIFIIPFVLILVMIGPIETMISNPVSYLINLDKVHKMTLHIYGLSMLYILQDDPLNMPDLCGNDDKSLKDVWNEDGGVPANLGGDCKTNKMIVYFSDKVVEAMDEISEIKKENSKNQILINVKEILFNNVTQFYTFINFNQMGPMINKSVQQNVMDSVSIVMKIGSSNNPYSFAESREIATLLFNSFNFEAAIKVLTDQLLEYIIDHTRDIKKIFTILEITLSIAFPVIFIVVAIIMNNWNRIQKKKIYRCFNALPKTTMSRMIENSNINTVEEKDDQSIKTEREIENERQEEKAITILRSGDIGNHFTRIIGILTNIILIVIINLIFVTYGCQYYIQNSNVFIHSSPLLKYLSYAYCDAFSSLLFLSIKAWTDNGLNNVYITEQQVLGFFFQKVQDTTESYNIMFYGDSEQQIYTVSKYVDDFNKYVTSICTNQTIDADVAHTMYRCLSYDSLYHYYMISVKKLFYENPIIGVKFNLSSSELFEAWHIILGHLFSKYMEPLMEEISDSVQHVFTNSRSTLIIVSVVLLILGLICSFNYIGAVLFEEKELKQILLLLLHAPPQEILESSYIMSIISGDFSSHDEETGNNLDENVFKSITENYPDGLIIYNNNGAVLYKNSKAEEILSSGKNKEKKTKENLPNNGNNLPNEIILGQSSFKVNGRSIEAKYSKIEGTKTLVALSDMSTIQKLEKEVEEETKRKSDLMTQFMPQILTPKVVSNQEQGVSFSVQSVTISMIFVDLDAKDDRSIEIFNEIHNSLSSLIFEKKFQTIESIEILGDLFMVIGGLFDEVNQSERHAQEVIKFSLEAIEKVKIIKEKFQIQNSQTLCGVATGGPVSGGVIELDMPIFEVCGDVVDLAEEMMMLGITDVVHTTRAVYELIYGRDFQIKERGEIQIPNFGSAVTYIVSVKEAS